MCFFSIIFFLNIPPPPPHPPRTVCHKQALRDYKMEIDPHHPIVTCVARSGVDAGVRQGDQVQVNVVPVQMPGGVQGMLGVHAGIPGAPPVNTPGVPVTSRSIR